MSEPDFYLCDVCGKHLPKELRIMLPSSYVDLETQQPIQNPLDLCNKCMFCCFQVLITKGQLTNRDSINTVREIISNMKAVNEIK